MKRWKTLIALTGPMPAVQGGSITKGIPGTRVHQEPSISYRGGSITQVRSFCLSSTHLKMENAQGTFVVTTVSVHFSVT